MVSIRYPLMKRASDGTFEKYSVDTKEYFRIFQKPERNNRTEGWYPAIGDVYAVACNSQMRRCTPIVDIFYSIISFGD